MCVGEECKCARGVRDLLCRSFPPGAADKTRVSSRPPSFLHSCLFFDLAVVAHLCTSNAPTDDMVPPPFSAPSQSQVTDVAHPFDLSIG